MPYLDLNDATGEPPTHALDGQRFAQAAVEFTALGLVAGQGQVLMPQLHLYALAIELALKSLALRSGANIKQCVNCCHVGKKTRESLSVHWMNIILEHHLDTLILKPLEIKIICSAGT